MSYTQSVLSVLSVFSHQTEDERPEDLSNKDLLEYIESLRKGNFRLQHENLVIETYLMRTEPDKLMDIVQIKERAHALAEVWLKRYTTLQIQSRSQDLHVPGGTEKRGSRQSLSTMTNKQNLSTVRLASTMKERHHKVAMKVRMDIAAREAEYCKRLLDSTQAKARKERLELHVTIDNAHGMLKMIHDMHEEVERGMTGAMVKGRITSENFFRVLAESLRSCESKLEKVCLETMILRQNLRRLNQQVPFRREQRSKLHPIDFEKLQMENSRLAEVFEVLKKAKIAVTSATGTYGMRLHDSINELNAGLALMAKHEVDTKGKTDLLQKLDEEREKVQEEVVVADARYRRMLGLVEKYRVPSVMDYVETVATVDKLKKNVHNMERHVKVQQTGLTTLASDLRRIRSKSLRVQQLTSCASFYGN